MPKLSAADVARIRQEADAGATHAELAKRFQISARHIGRIVRGEAHTEEKPAAEPGSLPTPVTAALDRFLADLALDSADCALAAGLRAVALKLDTACASTTTGSAVAAPALFRELAEGVEKLRGGEGTREFDQIDMLQAERKGRRQAMLEANKGRKDG
jgi:hypothetical protein